MYVYVYMLDRLILPVCTRENYDPLELAAAVEEKSAHPLASAIVSGTAYVCIICYECMIVVPTYTTMLLVYVYIMSYSSAIMYVIILVYVYLISYIYSQLLYTLHSLLWMHR